MIMNDKTKDIIVKDTQVTLIIRIIHGESKGKKNAPQSGKPKI